MRKFLFASIFIFLISLSISQAIDPTEEVMGLAPHQRLALKQAEVIADEIGTLINRRVIVIIRNGKLYYEYFSNSENSWKPFNIGTELNEHGVFKYNRSSVGVPNLEKKLIKLYRRTTSAWDTFENAPEKIGWFRKLFSKKSSPTIRPKIIPGVAVDPVGVINLGLDFTEFKIAQALANKCYRIITGQVRDSALTKEKCEDILKEIRERPQFSGLDPLKQPGGDLFEVPEGYYKNWLGFYVRTTEQKLLDEQKERRTRMN